MRKIQTPCIILFLVLTFILSACSSVTVTSGGKTATAVVTSGNSQIHGNTAPDSGRFDSCPSKGDGGSAQLNTLKNRTDTATWTPMPFSELVGLPWPKSIERKPMEKWLAADNAEVAKNNGRPVSITGYLANAKREGPETPNCHLQQDRDFHIWLVDHPTSDRSHSIVVESTPRVRAIHPGWTIERIGSITKKQIPVRISGWTMLDPEHPDQVGQTRGTIWEIHPIMQIEIQVNGSSTWTPLDSANV